MKKENWIWLLVLVLRFFIAYSQDQNTSLWWNIDCGIDILRVDGRFLWDTDLIYTQSGINAHINSTAQVLEEMKTLRFFPDGAQKNCYTLPLLGSQHHLIRAGFYYGNYDGLSSPPTFDLFLDGKKWSTVDTSTIEGPIYHEVVYTPHGSEFDFCLVQTKKEDIPFVSSIELVSLPSDFYSHLEGDYSFILVSRTNLGGDEIRFMGLGSDELYNRVWTRGAIPSNSTKVSTLPDISLTIENRPPFSVMSDSLQSQNAIDPIILSVDLPQGTPPPQSAYFVFYFNEIASQLGGTRTIEIYIDGQMKSTVKTLYGGCKVVTVNALIVTGTTVNVMLSTENDSTLPAIISAMEVFVRGESYGEGQEGQGTNFSYPTRDNFFSAYAILIYLLWFMFYQCGG